jgi:ribosome-binding ATPase YchF (GTP1/OBG family)
LSEYLEKQLSQNIPINQLELNSEQKETIKGYNLLTSKPLITLVNYNQESEIFSLKEYLEKKKMPFLALSIKSEDDYSQLSSLEKEELP